VTRSPRGVDETTLYATPGSDTCNMTTDPPASNFSSGQPSPLPGERPTHVHGIVFSLACLTSWFIYLHRYTWNLIGPELEREYGLSKTETGTLFSFFTPTYGVGQIPSGIVCDLIGPHYFLFAILILSSLILPCYAIARSLSSLAVVRLLFGAAQAGAYPSLAKVTAIWFPVRSRTIVQGWVATFFGRGGGAMSSIILGTLLMGKLQLSWQWSLVVMGAAGVVFGLLFLALFRNSPDDDSRVNQAERNIIHEGSLPAAEGAPRVLPWRRALKNRSMQFFVITQVASAGADAFYVSFMGDYFLNAKGFQVLTTGLLVSLPLWGGAIGGIIGGFCNDWLIRWTGSRRWGRSCVGFTGKFLACLLMFVVVAQESGVAAGWALFVVKFFTDWSQPTAWGACTDLGGRYSATVFGIINTAGNIGALSSPILFGWILDLSTTARIVDGVDKTVLNYNPLFAVIAGMYVISAVCWLFINCTDSLEHDDQNVR